MRVDLSASNLALSRRKGKGGTILVKMVSMSAEPLFLSYYLV